MSVNQARALFIELVAQVPPERWDRQLAERAGADDDLRRKVAALLSAHRQADSFLERPAGPLGGTIDDISPPGAGIDPHATQTALGERPGTTLDGRYQL